VADDDAGPAPVRQAASFPPLQHGSSVGGGPMSAELPAPAAEGDAPELEDDPNQLAWAAVVARVSRPVLPTPHDPATIPLAEAIAASIPPWSWLHDMVGRLYGPRDGAPEGEWRVCTVHDVVHVYAMTLRAAGRVMVVDGVWMACGADNVWDEIPAPAAKAYLDLLAYSVLGADRTLGQRAVDSFVAGLARSTHFAAAPEPTGGAVGADGTLITIEEDVVVRRPVRPSDCARRARVLPWPLSHAAEGRPERFLAFLKDMFTVRDDSGEDEPASYEPVPDRKARIWYLLEWLGATLLGRATEHQSLPVLFGPAGTGKSTLYLIVEGLLGGHHHTAQLDPQSEDMFASAPLAVRPLLIGIPECGAGEWTASAARLAKAAIAGDTVHIRRMRENPTYLRPTAGWMLASNHPIRLMERDEPLFDRMVVLGCTGPKRRGAPGSIPNLHRVIVDAEASQIISLALKAYARMRERGQYTQVPSSGVTLASWRGTDLLSVFCSEVLARGPARVPKAQRVRESELYDKYRNWMTRVGGRQPLSRPEFTEGVIERLSDAGITAYITRSGAVRGFAGVVYTDGAAALTAPLPSEQRRARSRGRRVGQDDDGGDP
jgi:hypothetical protein